MTEKKKIGRPLKPLKASLEQIETLAGLGLTIEEICRFLGVTRRTLYKRKHEDPALNEAIERGRVRADAAVIQSLYSRATQQNG